MNLVQTIAVTTLVLHTSYAQVFPFSNLRAFFNKQGRDSGGISSSGANVSRPNKQAQAEHEAHLPSLPEFDSPDIFTINRDVEDERSPTVKRHPSDSSSGGRGNGRHRINTQLNIRNPHEDSNGSIFITPEPSIEQTEYVNSREEYSKTRPKKRKRIRQPQSVQEEPEGQHSTHIQSGKRLSELQYSENPVKSSHENSFTSEGVYVESIPSLAVAIEDDFHKPKVHNGLVDYLVPPKHPSVYEKALKVSKPRKSHAPGVSKFKSPAPSGLSKKEGRFRPKKQRDPVAPPSERPTKRHVGRRRPSLQREVKRKPSRKPVVEAAAAQMDEQITSETGFNGVGAAGHHGHGDERVEFQMHGQKGPHSYKFGYDTGKGHNRQFRFEEKDNHGRVKGHYGYYDKEGKLQVVNYEADPHTGFKAETV